jgi:RNA polymerase sigma factor (sigma-70 family)
MTTDVELIAKVKAENDSKALQELISRNTGIYVDTALKFTVYSDKIQLEEIKEDKAYNIYKWALSYNPEKKMKFSTYVGEMTKFLCMDILNQTPEKVDIEEIDEPAAVENIEVQTATNDALEEIKKEALKVEDSRFWQIIQLRHFSNGKSKSWRQIGREMGITHERARQIYNKHISSIQHYLVT